MKILLVKKIGNPPRISYRGAVKLKFMKQVLSNYKNKNKILVCPITCLDKPSNSFNFFHLFLFTLLKF